MSDFCVWLNDVEDGKLRDDLSEAQKDVLEKLQEQAKATSCAKKGKITLTLSYLVESGGAVHIDSAIDTKVPKPVRERDHFFIARDGGLTRKNPKQQELRFKDVSGRREIKDNDSKEGTTNE
jgi:hypothetical protein